MRVTKKMVEKSIYKYGMKGYIMVGDNASMGAIVICVSYETLDLPLLRIITSIMEDVEVSNKLERGFLDRSEIRIHPKEIDIIIKQDIKLKKPVDRITIADRYNAVKILMDDGNLSKEKATELLQRVGVQLLGEDIFDVQD